MKLVDILAKELKEWPEGVQCLTQSNVDREIYDALDGEIHSPLRSLNPIFNATKHHSQEREYYPVVTRAQWQAAVDALKAGEGMPPIGSHVVVVDDGTLRYGQGESGEVLAHVDGAAVIRMSYGLGCFLPRCLSTKEKIAKAKRSKACDKMYGVYLDLPESSRGNTSDLVEALYDAGYRKFEIVDKDDVEGEV